MPSLRWCVTSLSKTFGRKSYGIGAGVAAWESHVVEVGVPWRRSGSPCVVGGMGLSLGVHWDFWSGGCSMVKVSWWKFKDSSILLKLHLEVLRLSHLIEIIFGSPKTLPFLLKFLLLR